VSLKVRAGEILGVGGVLGSGKTELGQALAGIIRQDAGERELARERLDHASFARMMEAGVAYVPQERHRDGIILNLPVSWNMTLSILNQLAELFGLFISLGRERRLAQSFIQQFGIRTPGTATLAGRLSGGNQQKVVLSKWLARKPRLLILDSPTRGVDAGAKEEIYRILRQLAAEGLGIILITDELLELIGMSNRVLIMKDGTITHDVEAPTGRKPTEQQLVRYMV
jgi:ribose transport system ATP-binding protein